MFDMFVFVFFSDGGVVHDMFVLDDIFDQIQLFPVHVVVDLVEIVVDFVNHHFHFLIIYTYAHKITGKMPINKY